MEFDSDIEFLLDIEFLFDIEFDSNNEFDFNIEFDSDIEFLFEIEFYSKIKFIFDTEFVLIASAESRSARGASHQPAFMSSCLTISHTCLPCLPSGRASPSVSGVT